MSYAKLSIFALLLSATLALASGNRPNLPGNNETGNRSVLGNTPRRQIIEEATRLIGTKEATGRNDGPLVESILASVGLSKGDPWCAASNYFIYQKAGLSHFVPRSGWSPDWVARPTWLQGKGETPKPGDSFGIYFSSKGRVAHTGLIREWGLSTAQTLEGNTSNDAAAGSAADRDGGGFYSKRRLVRQIYAVRNWID